MSDQVNPRADLDASSIADSPYSGDQLFDALFRSEENTMPQASEVGTPQSQPVPQAQPAQPTSFELRTRTGSVYKTMDEVTRGIEEKDALIERMRQDAIARTGIDPATQRPVRQEPQQPQSVSYYQDPKRYLDDLVNGAETDPQKYVQAQTRLFDEYLAPVAPLFQNMARQNAEQQVSSELKTNFGQVRSTSEFQQTLEAVPHLKQAIENAEHDLRFVQQLPELYKVAFLVHAGRTVPQMVREQAQPVAQPVQPQRPSLSPSTVSAPVVQSGTPDLTSRESRQEFIKQMEARGIRDFKF